MTRFARAKGSKASNERVPEPATSWTEMKQSLLEQKKENEDNKEREKLNKQRNENYKAFLAEKEQEEFQNTQWASFPKPAIQLPSTHKNRKHSNTVLDFNEIKTKLNKVLNIQSKQNNNNNNSDDEAPDEQSSKNEHKNQVVKVKKSKPKLLKIVVDREEKFKNNNIEGLKNNLNKKRKSEAVDESTEAKKIKENPKKQVNGTETSNDKQLTDEEKQVRKKEKLQKRNKQKKEKRKQRKLEARLEKAKTNIEAPKNSSTNDTGENKKILTEEEQNKIRKKTDKKLRQLENKKKFKEVAQQENVQTNASDHTNINNSTTESNDFETNNESSSKDLNTNKSKDNTMKQFNENNKRQFKNTNPNKVKSKNSSDKSKFNPNKMRPHTMQINGKTIEVDYVDGFPVKKEDAERLNKLRKEMISKGLPRSEINIALKLERRRAEKAFAREKKNVCFNCRKSGHNLSECPELGQNQVVESAGTGICFKCGSTEHTHFECKVVKGMDYKFAQCFICKEQGHIAKQCPDNARGLYPKGGSCKVCGDVTHLKKDCPKFHAQQQQLNHFHVDTMDERNPDDLNKSDFSSNLRETRVNKIVKF